MRALIASAALLLAAPSLAGELPTGPMGFKNVIICDTAEQIESIFSAANQAEMQRRYLGLFQTPSQQDGGAACQGFSVARGTVTEVVKVIDHFSGQKSTIVKFTSYPSGRFTYYTALSGEHHLKLAGFAI